MVGRVERVLAAVAEAGSVSLSPKQDLTGLGQSKRRKTANVLSLYVLKCTSQNRPQMIRSFLPNIT